MLSDLEIQNKIKIRGGAMPKTFIGKPLYFDEFIGRDNIRVKKIETQSSINSISDAYDLFIENWDFELLPQIQEYKALLLNESKEALYEVTLQEHRNIKKSTLKNFYGKILELTPNATIIIAQNHAKKPIAPDQKILGIADEFHSVAEELGVSVKNHIILSKMRYLILPPFEFV